MKKDDLPKAVSSARPGRMIAVVALVLLGAVVLAWMLSRSASEPDVASASGPAKAGTATSQATPLTPRSRMMIADEPSLLSAPAGKNAADLYRQAFALVDQLTDEEKRILRDKENSAPLSPERRDDLLEKIHPIIMLLHDAATLKRCDWNSGLPSWNSTYDERVVDLSAIALWDSLQRISSAPDDAAANLLANNRLALNLRSGLVEAALSFGIQALGTKFVVKNADRFTPLNRSQLSTALSSSDGMNTFKIAVMQQANKEAQMFGAMKTGRNPDGSPLGEAYSGFRTDYFKSPVDWEKLTSFSAVLSKETLVAVFWQDPQFKDWIEKMEANAPSPYSREMVSFYASMRNTARHTLVKNHLIAAGLAIMDEGPARLASYLDPISGVPFVYAPATDGFSLQSRTPIKGKPLTISFKK